MQVSPTFDAEGRRTGTILTLIKEQPLAEQAFRDSEERLSRAIAETEAANRSRGEFLANMSHEIRTPMAAILGYADLLRDHLDDPDDLQCVATIHRNGRFLLEIINDILDLSKMDAGVPIVNDEVVRPLVVMEDVVSLMNVRAAEKGIRLEMSVEGKLPETIRSDGKRLRQILLNLVGNAIKFTDRGHVRLMAKLDADREILCFDVIDTGIGIRDEEREELFQPFTQSDASSTRSVGGTGLGLTISRRLANLLGGDIQVRSVLGKGSTFTVSIDTATLDGVPLIRPSEPVRDPPEFVYPSMPLDGRVLIVDDRREIRFLAQHFLEEAGCDVITANNGVEAIQRVCRPRGDHDAFDMIFMDMQMPLMDGYEATTALAPRGHRYPDHRVDGPRDAR